MADPITLGVLAFGGSGALGIAGGAPLAAIATDFAISAALSAVGGILQQGQAAEAQAESEANIAAFNQKVALQQAEEEQRAAAERSLIQEREGEKFKARQRAVAGSPLCPSRSNL